MLSGIVIAFLVAVGIPVMLLLSTAVLTGLFGWVLKHNAEATHEGSELIDLNR